MVRALLVRGMLAGVLAGALAAGFAWVFGEPQVDLAIGFEEHMHHMAGQAPEPELVGRSVQSTIGLLTGILVYGTAIGGILALAFAYAYGRIGRLSPRATASLLALAGFLMLILVPQIKYPANPPSIGDPETIGWRTALYFTMIAVSVIAAVAATSTGRQLVRRLDTWNSAVAAGASYLIAIVAAMLILPTVNEVPAEFSATTLWNFRLASLGIEAVLWTALGLVFGALAETRLGGDRPPTIQATPPRQRKARGAAVSGAATPGRDHREVRAGDRDRLVFVIALLVLCVPTTGSAQLVGPTPTQGNAPSVGRTISPPAENEAAPEEDWAIHGQSTFAAQYHPGLRAAFSGPQSLAPHEQARETWDVTLYGGVRPWQGGEIWVNPEIDQGFGLSRTLGIAGFVSGEAYKAGAVNPYPRIPRVFLRQTFDLGGERQPVAAAANQLGGNQTADRIVLTLGKFAVTDVFDTNQYAHDARNDFLNWSVIDAGSFDYAADAWGFTYGASAEWYQDWWTMRSGLFTLSRIPNSKALDTRWFDQYQYVQEFEERHTLFGQPGKLKILGFLLTARMGAYDQATAIALQTGTPANIAAVRSTHTKAGFSFNLEQQIADDLGIFARTGWTQGNYEAFEFTDINKTLSFGGSLGGTRWGRADDRVGLAFAVNDASQAAKRFFAAGGLGILVGDGMLLHSGPEKIIEAYYSPAAFSFARLTLDYQFVVNPAYNRDRGPVSVFGIRAHAEF
jgi:high affinity Mn2+ porin